MVTGKSNQKQLLAAKNSQRPNLRDAENPNRNNYRSLLPAISSQPIKLTHPFLPSTKNSLSDPCLSVAGAGTRASPDAMGQCCTGGGKAVAGDEAEPGTSKAAPPSRGTSSKNGSAKQQPCSPAAKAAATEAAAAASSSKKPAGPIGEVLERPMEEVRTTYSIGKELGRGQFGVTHLCTHKATGEKLACKTIAKRKLANKEDVDDVRREVQIMHHLSGQPNIVDLRGAYEDKHNVHLVMELCAGGELFDRIIARGHYTERAAAALLRAIVGIVHTCHSMGVIHRDLKPENFLLLSKGDDAPLKATDFGLSVFFKEGEVFRDIVGSAYYIAPEVLKRKYGPEADIWSIGVMLYIFLAGVPPFWAESENAIFTAILRGQIDLASEPWPKISSGAKDLVRKMLNINPKERLTAFQVLSKFICYRLITQICSFFFHIEVQFGLIFPLLVSELNLDSFGSIWICRSPVDQRRWGCS